VTGAAFVVGCAVLGFCVFWGFRRLAKAFQEGLKE
jgi:hypothetical protein